jgi:hypothetical protein
MRRQNNAIRDKIPVTLWSRELPFRGKSQMLIVQILNEEPPALRQLDARIPRDLETICLKCLEKDPARRYASAAELASDLRRWLTGHPITARPVSRAERAWRWCRRNSVIALVSAILIAVIGIATAELYWINLERARAENARLSTECFRYLTQRQPKLLALFLNNELSKDDLIAAIEHDIEIHESVRRPAMNWIESTDPNSFESLQTLTDKMSAKVRLRR